MKNHKFKTNISLFLAVLFLIFISGCSTESTNEKTFNLIDANKELEKVEIKKNIDDEEIHLREEKSELPRHMGNSTMNESISQGENSMPPREEIDSQRLEREPIQEEAGERPKRGGAPQEAIDVCLSLSEGDICSF